MTDRSEQKQGTPTAQNRAGRSVVRVDKEEARKGTFTPEMWKVAHELTHPEGDPYDNARKMGFYCEQCG